VVTFDTQISQEPLKNRQNPRLKWIDFHGKSMKNRGF